MNNRFLDFIYGLGDRRKSPGQVNIERRRDKSYRMKEANTMLDESIERLNSAAAKKCGNGDRNAQ